MATDKALLTEQLQSVFIERGYDGATLVHLAHATGLSKASLYHHYPGGKPEMAATLVRHAIARLQRLAFQHLNANATPARALEAFIAGFGAYTNYGHSACFLAVISHHGTAHEEIAPLQLEIARQFEDWHQMLAATFEAMGNKPKRAERLAHELMASLYGALMNAKIHREPRLFEKALARLTKELTQTE